MVAKTSIWTADKRMSTARVIKKYPNRRLYDTEESRYITLADVKDLVINKIEFVVIDKKSGNDITRTILLQVISEHAHRRDVLRQEIRKLSESRDRYIEEKVEAEGGADDSLDEKIYRAVKGQAASVGLSYDSDTAKY